MANVRLIFVHGRAQEGKSEEELIAEWLAPLRQTLGERASILDDAQFAAPFYGDKLIELVQSLGEAIPDDIIVRGTDDGIDEDYRQFIGEYLEQIRLREGISDQDVAAEAGIEVTERGPQNWRWVLAIIRTLDRVPGLDGDMIERGLRDVWIYLERASVRQRINAIVEPAFDTDLPIVVVAHSLGSIVAYDIIRDRSSGSIPQLVTVGSPLGLKIAREALAPIRHPAVVQHWFNARDTRDVVALYPLTAAHFEVDPAITDFSEVRNRTSNAHGISGYLNDATTVGYLHRALRDAGTHR